VVSDQLSVKKQGRRDEIKLSFLATDNFLTDYCRFSPSAVTDEVPRIASVPGSDDSKTPGRQIEGFGQELNNLGYVVNQ
jgi:hypothetical protein